MNTSQIHEALQQVIADPVSESLEPDPDSIFAQAISEMDTQPLPKIKKRRPLRWQDVFQMLFCISLILTGFIGIVWAAATYPVTTVDIVPVEKIRILTAPLAVNLRHLAPITLTKSLSASTTGKGHQDARAATGKLTFYNGQFIAQTITIGTVFTGNDGVKIAIDQAVTIPAANPPQFGVATVNARTIAVGAAGNINALDINTSCCLPSVAVKNTAPFTGGIDARDYQAIAQTDIDSLTSKLKQVLSQQIQRAFTLRPGEALHTTTCILKASSYHQAGEEAKTVIVEVVNNCEAVAYNQTEVTQKATETYITEDNPGMLYRLVGSVQVRVLSVSPFTVGCSGTWAYLLTQGYQRYHATRFAGDTPEQAKRYLLNTGFIGQVMIAQNLPKDADYIRFRVFVGL